MDFLAAELLRHRLFYLFCADAQNAVGMISSAFI